MLKYTILEEEVTYTGRELRGGWVRARTGFSGDAAAGFVGPCHVKNEDLVDMDDARAGAFIKSAAMAHVIVEHPRCGLGTAVLRQRILVCLLCELLGERGHRVRRSGDDAFVDERKLTVSIAAPGPRSSLIHLGVNVDPRGAPVPAVGLDEMKIDAVELLKELLDRYVKELASAAHAEKKVRPVRDIANDNEQPG
jgi:hypothetical protein